MRDACRLSVTFGTMIRALVSTLVLAAAFALLAAASAHAQATESKVLVYHGASDATTDAGLAALEAIGTADDITVDETELASDLTAENLADYRAVVFLNTPGDRLSVGQEMALEAYVEGGGGFLGIGSAAEVEPGMAFFDALIGARPASPSPTTASDQVVEVGDRVHPATKDLPLEWHRTDIFYQWTTRPTGTVHTLARYRAPDAPAGDGTNTGGTDTPITWCRDLENGRTFYTGLGRTAGSYDNEFKGVLAGGLKWSAGLVRAGCKATIASNYRATRIVSAGPTTTGLATSGESHGLSIAPNGWVFYIGRGDCRTDAERGALIGKASQPRVLDHSDPNVGLGCGNVHVWDPSAANGTENSGITRAATLAVYADGGTGSERTNESQHKMEYGLLGVTVAPDFMQSHHIYLQYFPSFNPQAMPPGLPVERRISKMSRPRVSRFTVNMQTKKIDLASEVRIFEYDAQVFSCCHVGGGMGFDSQGNLYVTTGDTNSSQGTNGASGNNPDAKCPTGPANEASSAHCGANTFSYQDARRTAGNTNDYNGKMLRLKPIDVPDGQHPTVGVNSTYTIPGEDAPNGPNLFDGTEGGGGKAKPEIYAMGLRNPSRLSIDPKTDIPYSGWVGPDAGSPNRELGPSTYETLSQIDHAGNYGWPYCMGNKQAYRDRVPGNTPRTTPADGYVPGGPASGGTEGWYDCDNLHNDSPNNTGLTVLPHETGTGMDAGKVRPVNIWYSRGNPGGNGCPEFPRPRGAGAAPDYGAQNTQLCPWATANGATVMDGPVYRYNDGASDNSRRWPKYWDGRWFIQDHGNTSVKHAVLLDPATDQDGGQPVYADSFRGIPGISWQGSYMDSKFGPDGAWYVQTYDGFFRAGPNAGITRIDYIGGPDTPSANPTGTPIGNRRVRFSSAGSGGMSLEWDFGDGTTSSEANPTHTYADGGHFNVKLTVTYADGGTSVKTIGVDVLDEADESAPVTTATLNPAQPGPGGTYDRPVTVTLSATDTGGTGVASTEYSVNGGPTKEYTGPIQLSSEREHTVEFFSTDGVGNVEATKSVSFTIAIPEGCPTTLSDEFDGSSIESKWRLVRPIADALSVSGGRLHIKVRNGDMIGGTATARNMILQQTPAGGWSATTKLDISDLSGSGEQAGIVVWQSENPNNFVKIVFINKGGGTRWFEYVLTQNNNTIELPNSGAQTDIPDDVYVRAIGNGEGSVTAQYSLDGEEFKTIGTMNGFGTDLEVGLKVSDTADSENAAHFDWFHFKCRDFAPPATTATVAPDAADGQLGWYTTAPNVTLAANDGSTGSGVEKTEYRIGTSGAFQTYNGPFTVNQAGRLTIQYRSTDGEGNEETIKSLSLAVDPQAPTTGASVTPAAGDSMRVALNAGDGSGAGVKDVRYRVDGGPWRTYSAPPADQVLMDGTQAMLDEWTQAGPGGFDLQPDGSIQAHGGLGMLWYPVRQFGDFSFKVQFRDARTDGGYANGGAFVRFPDPEATVALPSTERPACVSPGEDRPEWVAIYCGHELQMYDGPTGEPQKTGSVYNFQSLNLAQAFPVPKGTWSDYEIRVVGQQFTLIRDGRVINQFDNSIPRDSSRAGDPPTQARQFSQGYIGLQNHSDADKIQIRNLRVQDLSNAARTGTGAFLVSGRGNHTVEFRSTDWAGNMESTKAQMFRIGGPPQSSPPETEPPAPATFRLGKLSVPKLRSFAKRGLKVTVRCTDAMRGAAGITVSKSMKRKLKLKSRTVARKAIVCGDAGNMTVRLKPSKKTAKALRRSHRSVKAVLTVKLRATGEGTRTRTRSLKLRR
jgi:PKD repeat protein/glucose/arabinose dehydrogenase/type 1 glutamine amidotransferase